MGAALLSLIPPGDEAIATLVGEEPNAGCSGVSTLHINGVKWASPDDTNKGTDMTLNEFQAWLEGYSEAFTSGAPTAAQWEKIREKLREVKLVKTEQSVAPLLPRPTGWPDQRYQLLDVRGKEHPSFADPIVSPLLKPQITCTGKALS